MSIKLRELIRAVRACKTAADERAVISKECALIRTSFKSPDNPYRHRNVAKLLYMHMLGYPTHFGQMECVKLIASPAFPEKRIGYLGLMILLDEKHQVLMLVTNSLKTDFSNKNPYIVGLALASLGNICSADMARDLANEVEKFFRHQNAYIRKKAALCATRIIRKVPELVEEYTNSVASLLNDKNHAVLLTAVTLILEMLKQDPRLLQSGAGGQPSQFRKLVPTVVRLLKNLVLAGYVSEYDVVGITDPFLQCKLIQLLRVLGTGDREATEQMNDILAQSAINCFPAEDHQVLTERGFMYYDDVMQHFEQQPTLNVACYVDGALVYAPITPKDVTMHTGVHRHILFAKECAEGEAPMSLLPSDNHRMFGRVGSVAADGKTAAGGDDAWAGVPPVTSIYSADAVLQAGRAACEPGQAAAFQFEARFELGVTATGEPLPFVSALGLCSDDEVDAFLELYGAWLASGWLDAQQSAVCVGLGGQPAAAYVAALLARLPGVAWSEAADAVSGQLCAAIVSPQWWSFVSAAADAAAIDCEGPRFMPWVFRALSVRQLRLVVRGLQQSQTEAACIRTATLRFRDELVQVLTHAGFAVHFEMAQAIAGDCSWRVMYSEEAKAAQPRLVINSDVSETKKDGTIWCVTVPTKDQLIMFRRVLSRRQDGVVLQAGRPVIVGNTDANKNPGNAILYETVLTIMSVEAEGGLRVLAINILGRFLTNRDNNIRYVALTTLCKCVNKDTAAVQRHRNTVVDSLKDADISIRRRALDLIYALVTKNNVKALVKELLNYLALTTGDLEFKADLTEKICLVVERFAPSKHWHIDTIIQVLSTAGNFTRETVATDLILLVARTPTLQAYSVYKLFHALNKKAKHAQLPLIHVVVWCIGEYGDMLLSNDGYQQAFAVENVNPGDVQGEPPCDITVVSEAALLDLLQRLAKSPLATPLTKQYILNALIKLTGRFASASGERERLKQYIQQFQTSMNMELQQRSCEYATLASDALAKVRPGVVGRMPVPAKKAKPAAAEGEGADGKKSAGTTGGTADESSSSSESDDDEPDMDDEERAQQSAPKPVAAAAPAAQPQPQRAGVDLFDIMGVGGAAPAAGAPAPAAKPAAAVDLLDLFGGGGAAPAPAAAPAASHALDLFGMPSAHPPAAAASHSLDMFGAPAPSAPAAAGQQTFPPERVYDNGKGLTVTFAYSRPAAQPESLTVIASFGNSSGSELTGFDFQVAVLKHVQLTLLPASASSIPPHSQGAVTQQFTLLNSLHGKKKLLIRVKIDYRVNGQLVSDTAQIDKFPA